MSPLLPFVFVAKILVLGTGLIVMRLSYRAYRRTESAKFQSLTIAFGIIMLSGLIAGVLESAIPIDPGAGVVLTNLLMASGFALLAFSLYKPDDRY